MSGFETILNYIPYMLDGLKWTFTLVFGGFSIGFLTALPIATIHEYGSGLARASTALYIWFFRGTPLLVLLFLFYWGILPAIGFKLGPLETSILVLGLRSAAYQSQIIRSALKAVGEGQALAAEALGFSKVETIIYIIIPQALRMAIPSLANEYSILLKDSAICFTLGVAEILTRARYVVTATGVALIPYLFAGIILWLLSIAGLEIADIVYSRVRIPGLVEAGLNA